METKEKQACYIRILKELQMHIRKLNELISCTGCYLAGTVPPSCYSLG